MLLHRDKWRGDYLLETNAAEPSRGSQASSSRAEVSFASLFRNNGERLTRTRFVEEVRQARADRELSERHKQREERSESFEEEEALGEAFEEEAKKLESSHLGSDEEMKSSFEDLVGIFVLFHRKATAIITGTQHPRKRCTILAFAFFILVLHVTTS